jgi:hypothetical protein
MKIKALTLVLCLAMLSLTLIQSCQKNNAVSPSISSCGTGLLCAVTDGISFTSDPYSFIPASGTNTGTWATVNISGGYIIVLNGQKLVTKPDTAYSSSISMSIVTDYLPVRGRTYSNDSVMTRAVITMTYDSGYTLLQVPGNPHYDFPYHSNSVDAITPGYITISNMDTIQNLVSGTFAFTAYGSGSSKAIVTNGTFTNVKLFRP